MTPIFVLAESSRLKDSLFIPSFAFSRSYWRHRPVGDDHRDGAAIAAGSDRKPTTRTRNMTRHWPTVWMFVMTLVGAESARAQSATTAVLTALRDRIALGGEATRVVSPPFRYQLTPPRDAQAALARILGVPMARRDEKPLICRSALGDSTTMGMEISVTELDVRGDSAKVSVLRRCRQNGRERQSIHQSEPTWFLHRQGGRWLVVRTLMRVTARPSDDIRQVG